MVLQLWRGAIGYNFKFPFKVSLGLDYTEQ